MRFLSFARARRRFGSLAILLIVISLDATGATKFRVVHNFKGGSDGAGPSGGLTWGEAGSLYGTTRGGGTGQRCMGGCGTVFTLTPAFGNWKESVVHSFDDPPAGPFGGVIKRDQEELGTMNSDSGGLLFAVGNHGGWRQQALPDGGSWATLLARNGFLYGTGVGVIFKVTPDSNQWLQSVIYTFHPEQGHDGTDGDTPAGSLIADASGNLYGVTKFGGNYTDCGASTGCGTVFELVRSGNGTWEEHVLYRFAKTQNDGQLPMAGLYMDSAGNLYGTTYQGGRRQTGTIFQLHRDKTGQWHESVLFDFPRSEDGGGPMSPLAGDRRGNLYGTAGGGSGACSCGVVFELGSGRNGRWLYHVLHHFHGKDGAAVDSGLLPDDKGTYYGTTLGGGMYSSGVVFEITP